MQFVLGLMKQRSTWIILAALANAAGLYVNPTTASAIADVATAAARSIDQEQCAAPVH